MKIFCKHQWAILSEKTTKSRFEMIKENGGDPSELRETFFERKFIQVATCSKCGKLKRFVTNL